METLIILLLTIVVFSISVVLVNFVLLKSTLSHIDKNIEKVQCENQIVPEMNDETGCYTFVTDDNLKVMQLTDVHIGGGVMSYTRDKEAIHCVAAMISEEKPDLVVITGDTSYAVPFQAGTFNNKSGAKIIAQLMDKLGVYWAISLGNHDSENYNYYSREKISNFYIEDAEYCLFTPTDEDIDGYGNYVVNVQNSDKIITQSLFVMDTGAYVDGDVLGAEWKYDGLHENQINWYKEKLQSLEAYNKSQNESASMPKSLLFMHIPFEEYKTAWNEYAENDFKNTKDVKYYYGTLGEVGEGVYSSLYPDEMFETMLELGSTQGVFCGHDHLNNFSLDYKGIRLTYGMSVDFLAYRGIRNYGVHRGCTIIDVAPDGTFDCYSEGYYQDKYDNEVRREVSMTPYYE